MSGSGIAESPNLSGSRSELKALIMELISEHDLAITNADHIEELPIRNVYLQVHQSLREKLRQRLTALG